ncbi:MAG: AI-2E family transporter [Acetobacteraceae bacterium]|nr:AI-2E family transporter [Acetobacteraceae bacterium]
MGEGQMEEGRFPAGRILALVAAAALAFACFLVARPFLSALLWAVIIVFCTWPFFQFLTRRLRLSPGWAATVMVLAEFLLLGLPLIYALPTRREEIEGIRRWVEETVSAGPPDLTPLLSSIPFAGPALVSWWAEYGIDFQGLGEAARPYVGQAAQIAFSVFVSILSGLAELLVAIFLAWFIYRDGPAIVARSEAVLQRLSGDRARHMLELTGNVTRGVVYGLIGTAVIQGAMTTFGLWVAGVPQHVLLGVIAGLISILPVGAPLVWLPAAIWLLLQGSTGWGLFLLAYGGLGISSVDNVIRPWFISRGADLPFLLTLIGALGGVLAFGLLGLFLGPVVLAVGFSLLRDWATNAGQGGGPARD